ncbi:hypothetical protein F5Y08DRAFT_317364 [Xylaria arbuscula]|nr:hypothetical protein F5Y08DRAFT_317364 [Xylaria arbuscula]
MRAVSVILACAASTQAATIAPRSYPPPPGPWTAGVWRPVPPIHFGDGINANNGYFWLGKEPTASCPSDVEGLDCSAYPGSKTVFSGGNDTVSLLVGVDGGQQVYVEANGALAYTKAHSDTLPEGALTNGFSRAISDAGGAPTILGFEYQDQYKNWLLCPVDGSDEVYQIFLGPYNAECVPVEMRTYTSSGPNAWEYS